MRRSSAASLARTAALIAVGAFAVHQLRYLAGYGDAAGSELSRQGHGYLAGALPILAAFLLSAVAASLLRAALGRRSGAPGECPEEPGRDTFGRRAALFAAGILVVFCVQESLEGALCAGHPGGARRRCSPTAAGSRSPSQAWSRSLCALLDRGIVDARGGDRGRRRAPCPGGAGRAPAPRPRPALLVPLSASPLAFGIARRPPPARATS